jgi:uncharacterized protein
MRAVFDTVVFVRALINPRSLCGRLVFDFQSAYQLIVSPELEDEYVEVLVRREIVRKYRAAEARDIATVLQLIARAQTVLPVPLAGICRDPEDDKFLAAAITGEAAYIVSEDRDLLDLGEHAGVPILSAAAFLAVLERGAE